MQRVTIYGPNLYGVPETFHVHAEGCADTRKALYRQAAGEAWSTSAESIRGVVEDVYSDIIAEQEEGSDWSTWEAYLSEFKFFPCVELPLEAEDEQQASG